MDCSERDSDSDVSQPCDYALPDFHNDDVDMRTQDEISDSTEKFETELMSGVLADQADPLNKAISKIEEARKSENPHFHLKEAQKYLDVTRPNEGKCIEDQFRNRMLHEYKEYVWVALQGPEFPGFERTAEGCVVFPGGRRLFIPSEMFSNSTTTSK